MRSTAEAAIRNIVRQFHASPEVADAYREAMGIPTHIDAKRLTGVEILSRPLEKVDASEIRRFAIGDMR